MAVSMVAPPKTDCPRVREKVIWESLYPILGSIRPHGLARKGSRQQPGPSGRAWYSSIPPSSTIVAAPLPLILTQSQAEYSSARAFHPSRERGRGGLDTYRSISHRICSGPMRRRKGRLLGLGVGPKALRSQGAPTAKQQQIMRHYLRTPLDIRTVMVR
jgi:hypothetical protein